MMQFIVIVAVVAAAGMTPVQAVVQQLLVLIEKCYVGSGNARVTARTAFACIVTIVVGVFAAVAVA